MPSLKFKGKSAVWNHHLTVPCHELIPRKQKSVTKKLSLQDNLIVHGDNLLALKALLPTYAGKVKCIYIDPPYNTGNEGWAYNDNVNSPMLQDWLGKTIDREDLTRHDKWLCMMTPRLRLLRELLREDGVIFISIGDDEQHRLRELMDEIFGEENFIASFVWQKTFSKKSKAQISGSHDYIHAFARDLSQWERNLLPRKEQQIKAFKNPDNDPRGAWQSVAFSVQSEDAEKRKAYRYAIELPSGRKVMPPTGRHWNGLPKRFEELRSDGRIWFGGKGNNPPRLKVYLSEVQTGIVPDTWWTHKDAGNTQEAKKEILEIFRSQEPFSTPKPSRLIKRIAEISSDKNSIILDSFAGSGTTAHATLALNAEDGGNRKFVLIECEDYADKITAERVRRVMKGVKSAKDEKLKKGYGGTFSYFELGKAIELESILEGKHLPSYRDFARYIFYTATGEEFDESAMDEKKNFIGESKEYKVYFYYKPDIEYLKSTAFTLDRARALGPYKKKKRLVFAPVKFLDEDDLERMGIAFAQLPFEIYKLTKH